jgi:hypothetical protein
MEPGMKPHVICHMLSRPDGRILGRRWRPRATALAGLFEQLHDQLGCDARIVGRVTGGEFAKGEAARSGCAIAFAPNERARPTSPIC